jgi:hypothetical protein
MKRVTGILTIAIFATLIAGPWDGFEALKVKNSTKTGVCVCMTPVLKAL